ncbi:hypothetical protein ADUPG1_005478, partial [Aduncisulcus paluster]
LDAMERALERRLFAIGYRLQEVVVNCPAGEAYGTLDDSHVFFSGIYVSLFKFFVSIALVGGNKTGSHLDSSSPHIEEFADVFTGINTAGSDNRDGAASFLFEG